MNQLTSLSLFLLTVFFLGCGESPPKNFSGSTEIEFYEIAEENTQRETKNLNNDLVNFVVYKEPVITKSHFRNASISKDQVSLTEHNYAINFEFKKEASKFFKELTTRNVGKPMPITVNGNLISAPRISAPITGGHVQITGTFTKEEALNYIKNL